jgi:hypothetical protein
MAPAQARPTRKNSRWVGISLHLIGEPAIVPDPLAWTTDEDTDREPEEANVHPNITRALQGTDLTVGDLACQDCGSHRFHVEESTASYRTAYLDLDDLTDPSADHDTGTTDHDNWEIARDEGWRCSNCDTYQERAVNRVLDQAYAWLL